MRRRRGFNLKRRICPLDDKNILQQLADAISYGGNPEHKRNPGDFGLEPPSAWRPDKALCDETGIVEKEMALSWLKAGMKRGVVSKRWQGDFPQNVWAVMEDGTVLEAQLENKVQGVYHGYPLPRHDAFGDIVRSQWRQACQL